VARRLEAGEPYVIRFKMPRGREVRVQDRIRGLVVVQTAQLDDKVLFKSDGMPTYHLANVVDDRLMQITHVIRGEEWLPSTPLHVLLYEAFGWLDTMPEFAHLPLLLKPDGDGKLSKRDGDRLGLPFYATEWTNPETGEKTPGYREAGYFPEAYVNFLALLGWNPGDNREIFGMNELVQAFGLERVNKHGARYDFTKLQWFNQQYLRSQSVDSLVEPCRKLLVQQGWELDDATLRALIPLVMERMVLVSDFVSEVRSFFVDPESYDEGVVAKKWGGAFPAVLGDLIQGYETMQEEWRAAAAESLFKEVAAKHGVAPGSLLQGLRLAVTGQASGPALFEWMGLRGRSACVARLRRAAAALPPVA
jgi:glutamyl-tRNA synthetase